MVLGGLLVMYAGAPEKAERRFLFYILVIAVLAGLVALLGPNIWQTPYNNSPFYISGLLQPVMVGILALLVLHLGQLRGLRGWQAVAVVLLALALVWISASLWQDEYFVFYYALGLALVLAAVWIGGVRSTGWFGLFLGLGLLTLALYNEPLVTLVYRQVPQSLPQPLLMTIGLLFYAFPVLLVGTAAVLVYRAGRNPKKNGVSLEVVPGGAPQPGIQGPEMGGEQEAAAAEPVVEPPAVPEQKPSWRAALHLGLAALLLGALAYTVYWSSIWDHTRDGLGGLFIAQFGAMVGIGAGMLLAIFSPGWRRLGGFVFLALVPLLLFQAFERGWQVSYHAITEQRAADIAEALERYHDRRGTYPQTLGELAPRDLLVIRKPVIFQGEPWCYQATAESYRLGAVYREFFGMPVSIHIYASTGDPLDDPWDCDDRLVELQERYPSFVDSEPVMPPQEERQPLSEVPAPRQPLSPIVEGNLLPGRWSPDGRYFSYTQGSALGFINVTDSSVCPAEVEQLPLGDARSLSAWLPEGRVLAITAEGGLVLHTPCGGTNSLAVPDESPFSQVLASDTASGRVLLETEHAFWIFDAESQSLLELSAISPNPYEAHWDNAAWLPGGARLAISRLNGRDASAGSTLVILDGSSGEEQLNVPLEFASDQSAPWVEWLAQDELLLNGGGGLLILDLAASPPNRVDVMRDLLHLDLAYPDEISSMASVVDRSGPGYYLAVRANHPRNQALYLYSSASGAVQTFTPAMHSLLFFPDGQVVEMSKFELQPEYQDEYTLVVIPGAHAGGVAVEVEPALVAQGHTPRSYPHLGVSKAPGENRLYFSSEQGVSLVGLPGGEMIGFWDLGGGIAHVSGPPQPAARQHSVAVVDGKGIFVLPIPP